MRADLRHTPAQNQFRSLFARYERTFQAFRSLRFSSILTTSDISRLIRQSSFARLRAAAACLRLKPFTFTEYGLKPSLSRCTFPIYFWFFRQKKIRIYLSQTDTDNNHINYRIKLYVQRAWTVWVTRSDIIAPYIRTHTIRPYIIF